MSGVIIGLQFAGGLKQEMSVQIVGVGDVCVGSPVARFDPSAGTLWGLLASADLAIANLEQTLTERGVRADKPVTLRAHPSLVDEVFRLGFDAVTLANNHIMDFGYEGLAETLATLERRGIAYAGAGPNRAAAVRPATLTVGGLRIALLSFASTVPPGAAATVDRPGLAPIRVTTRYVLDGATNDEQPGSAPYVETEALESDVDAALTAISAARASHDLVIVGLHWGVMPHWMPPIQGTLADYQRPLAHRIIDAGADLLLGGHAHSPQGVEVYRSKLIAYCLGNFIFHKHKLPEAALNSDRPGPYWGARFNYRPDFKFKAGCLLRLWADAHRIERAELVPYLLDEDSEPYLVTGAEASGVLELVREASPVHGQFVVVGDRGEIPPALFSRD